MKRRTANPTAEVYIALLAHTHNWLENFPPLSLSRSLSLFLSLSLSPARDKFTLELGSEFDTHSSRLIHLPPFPPSFFHTDTEAKGLSLRRHIQSGLAGAEVRRDLD